jgi:hypothetical protein
MTELQNKTSGKFQKAFIKGGVFEKLRSCSVSLLSAGKVTLDSSDDG